MQYVIGDVARTLGLTPGALHFFEREGVISPRKGDNTRRTYSAEDVIRLISYRKYRSMEMPLKEIAHQFSPEGSMCGEIAAKMARQQCQAEEAARVKQSKIDAEYARRFGHLRNPETGLPIQTQEDYLAAIDAQEKQIAENQLKQSGVDPSIINQMIANNPAIRQAQELIAQAHHNEVMNQINNDVAMISQMDPSIKTLGDVPPEVIQLSMSTNMSIVNAYKVINYGKVSSAKQEAIQQAAINQAKGKQHMTPMNGISTPETGVDIPDSELAMWKETFPDKSMADLKKLYNETL